MRVVGSRRGATFVDALITIFLLGIIGLILSATFPTGFSCTRQAREYKVATAIAQRKVEQLRALNFESMTGPLLQAGGTVDSPAITYPFSFTSVDSVDSELPGGVGTVDIADAGPGLTRVVVTVSWKRDGAGARRSITLTTLFADKRTRALS